MKIFLELREYVGNALPHCFHASQLVSHMRDENHLFSCLDDCDRSQSFEFFKNSLYFLMPFGSFVVSDTLFDLLADISHLGLVFSVNIFSSFDEGSDLLVFTVDRFFLTRCSYSCALLKCCSLFF